MQTDRKSLSAADGGSTTDAENLFSFKRYFINNLDSYHGQCILAEVAKILEQNNQPSTHEIPVLAVAEDAEPPPPPPPEQPYEIIGTVTDAKVKKPDHVARIIPKAEVLPSMITCGTVILDISYDRDELRIAMDYMKLLKQLLEKLMPDDDAKSSQAENAPDAGAGESKKRSLILISTVMTWAATKPLDPESPELAFIETDFRKRKPHLNYKLHYDCENEVIGIARKYKSQIGALVVATGMIYGGREDVLYYWFQKAWECEKLLPILGRGGNHIPLLNVYDLAQIIYNLVSDFPKKLYILAVEQNPTKQREIVKPLGRIVGSGMFKCIPQEDAFLIPEIDQRIYDLMTINLIMEPTFIVETMGLQWTSDLTFAENVPMLMKQFRHERVLRPFKIVVYGPPIVGKTTLAKQIADNYGLIYVSPETVAQDIMEDLTWRMKHWEVGELGTLGIPVAEDDTGSVAEDTGEEEAAMEAARTTLAILTSGRPLTEEEILGYLRQRLLNHDAQNRGWVLDGFITSIPQCNALFERGDVEEEILEEDEDDDRFEEDVDLYANVLKRLLPDLVVSLEATDDFICEKAMRLPEGDSRLDEETILKRLTEFRNADARDVTPLNFFDELDIHPLVVPVNDHKDYDMKSTYAAVSLRMGRPCRYPTLLDKIEAAEKKEREEIESQRRKEEKALKELEKKIKEEREEKMEYWSEMYSLLREEEEAALAVAGEPMRNYLVNHIFPTLTPALLEVAKVRPDDPVDYLAEYLFKQNPSGKMLEPGYNLQAEMMLGKIKILDDALQGLDIKIDPLLPPEEPDELAKAKKIMQGMSAM